MLLPTQRYQTETMNEDHETREINEVTRLHAQRHTTGTWNEGIETQDNVVYHTSSQK